MTHTKKTAPRRTYAQLTEEFPLRPIRTRKQAEQAGTLAFELAARPRLTRDEQDYLDVLTAIIAAYEDEHFPIPAQASPVELLRYLMEENQLSLSQLASETGIQISTLSEILKGKRAIGLRHIKKLCVRFACEPAIWMQELVVA